MIYSLIINYNIYIYFNSTRASQTTWGFCTAVHEGRVGVVLRGQGGKVYREGKNGE